MTKGDEASGLLIYLESFHSRDGSFTYVGGSKCWLNLEGWLLFREDMN